MYTYDDAKYTLRKTREPVDHRGGYRNTVHAALRIACEKLRVTDLLYQEVYRAVRTSQLTTVINCQRV